MVLAHCGSLFLDSAALCQARRDISLILIYFYISQIRVLYTLAITACASVHNCIGGIKSSFAGRH